MARATLEVHPPVAEKVTFTFFLSFPFRLSAFCAFGFSLTVSLTTAAFLVAFATFFRPLPVAVSRPLPETLTRSVATGPRVATLASLTTATPGLERPWKKALPDGDAAGGCGDAPRQA